MRKIDVPRQARSINGLLDQARKEDLIVRAPDGSEFMVSVIDDFDREIAATRRNEKLMAFLDERARSKTWIPLEEVERKLGLSERPAPGSGPGRNPRRKK